jgi:hypothetical protein
MRLAELRTTDGRTLVLHPRFAIVEADETTRSSVLQALSGALSGGSPAAGFFEVHGIVLDLDRASFALLEVDPQLPLVLGPDDIPADAFGPSGARSSAADDVATKHRELVDAHKQQAQAALEVVTAVQAALRAATIGRDEAKARLDEAEHELDAAVASREAAERTVDALADANDTRLIEAEDAAEHHPGLIEAEVVEVVEVVEVEVVDEGEDVDDPWEAEREARAQDLAAAEEGVVAARREVEQSARAANPARLNADDRAALESAHETTLEADDRASKRFGGNAARRRLDEAKSAERAVLDRLGLDSYADFLLRSSMGATDPSAELRLEIARTELVEAEAALSAARSRAEAVPAPPPPRPVAATPKPPASVVMPVVAPEPLAAKPPVAPLGDGAARLAAAQRARDDAAVAESTAGAARDAADLTLSEADATLVELSVRYDEAEQTLAQARVRVGAVLNEAAQSNGHPSDPSWSDPASHGTMADEVDRHLLAWLAARGQHPLADPLPVVFDEVYRHVAAADLDALLLRLDHLADSVHVVYMTDDPKVLQWAVSLPPESAGVVVLPGTR